MTHFAAVAPLAIHRGLDEVGELGTYQLLIATEVLKDVEEYHFFWRPRSADQFIILDNGVIEEGYPLSVGRLLLAAQAVDANVIVLPDTIDDGKMTLKLARRTIPECAGSGRETMGVVQGTTWEECLDCADGLLDLGVDRLAVPRGLTKNLKTRVDLVRFLGGFHVPIHILGFSDNVADDIMAASLPHVTGIDAATPVWAGFKGIELPVEPPIDSTVWGPRPSDFWQRPHEDEPPQVELIDRNIQQVRRWLSELDVTGRR